MPPAGRIQLVLLLALAVALCGCTAAEEPAAAGCPEVPCAAGESCVAGTCKPAGACPDRPCPAGQSCIGGRCTLPDCEPRSCPTRPQCNEGFDDGCGGTLLCGCGAGEVCAGLVCCATTCDGAACNASDGCGGSCTDRCGTWVELRPAASPPARERQAMLWDPDRDAVLLFGGKLDSSLQELGDLWELRATGPAPGNGDPPPVTWTQLHDGSGITPRQSPALVRAWGRILLYGGCYVGPDCDEVLEWTGGGWAPFPTSGTGPGARKFFGLAFDEERSLVVLYGGVLPGDLSLPFPTAAYVLDEAGVWSELPDSTDPNVRRDLTLAWDGNAHAVRLYGGALFDIPDSDHWLLGVRPDGSLGWIPVDDDAPGPRVGATATWVPPLLDGAGAVLRPGRELLFGGARPTRTEEHCASDKLGDTWEVDAGGSWALAAAGGCDLRPAPRLRAGLAAAPFLDGVVLFGGFLGNFSAGDTYLLRAPLDP